MLTDERIAALWLEQMSVGAKGGVFIFARAVEAEARREALEEAAKVCESQEWDWDDKAFNCGDKIRALRDAVDRL